MNPHKTPVHGRDHGLNGSDPIPGIGGEISWEDVGVDQPISGDSSLNVILDGIGNPLAAGIKGDVKIDRDCTITSWTLLADVAGSIVVDIWKDTYANFPPTSADTITASARPTLASVAKATDSVLSGWTKDVSAGDTLRFNVVSAATVRRVTLELQLRPR